MMKLKAALLSFMLIVLIQSGFSQCSNFWQFEKGSSWEYEMFNGKGKPAGKSMQTVTGYETTTGGFKAVIHSVVTSEKGKEISSGDIEYTCKDGTLYIDMRKFVPDQQYKAFENYELKVEAENLEIPPTMAVGQTLKDGSVTLTASNSPIPMEMTVNVVERKVVATEMVETPAGKFDCVKVTSKTVVKNKVGLAMTFTFSAVEWYAPKVGMVKSESYDKNGKLAGYTVLASKK